MICNDCVKNQTHRQFLQLISANAIQTLMVLCWTPPQMQTARYNLCYLPVKMKQMKGVY